MSAQSQLREVADGLLYTFEAKEALAAAILALRDRLGELRGLRLLENRALLSSADAALDRAVRAADGLHAAGDDLASFHLTAGERIQVASALDELGYVSDQIAAAINDPGLAEEVAAGVRSVVGGVAAPVGDALRSAGFALWPLLLGVVAVIVYIRWGKS